jgi:hypothetical protein
MEQENFGNQTILTLVRLMTTNLILTMSPRHREGLVILSGLKVLVMIQQRYSRGVCSASSMRMN